MYENEANDGVALLVHCSVVVLYWVGRLHECEEVRSAREHNECAFGQGRAHCLHGCCMLCVLQQQARNQRRRDSKTPAASNIYNVYTRVPRYDTGEAGGCGIFSGRSRTLTKVCPVGASRQHPSDAIARSV